MEMRKIADFHSISERRSSENTTDGRHVKDFHQFQSINEDFPNLWRIVVSWYWESDAKLKNSPKPCVHPLKMYIWRTVTVTCNNSHLWQYFQPLFTLFGSQCGASDSNANQRIERKSKTNNVCKCNW